MASSKTIPGDLYDRTPSPAGAGASRIVGDATALRSVRNLTQDTLIGDAIELAGTGARRRKGLLGMTGLSAGEGLWIAPCESVHTFFMKFALDLIYLDRAHKVVKVCSNVPAWRLSACLKAHSILELPVGIISATNTRPGDQLEITDVYTQ